MWNGKKKAITFSYDDGITQDRRLINILNRHGLKCTFNLNSDLLGKAGSLIREDMTIAHCKSRPCEVPLIYAGHEVAAHTLTHPLLPTLSDEEVIRQVENDRLALSELVGYEVVGMAYPGGGKNYDERVAGLIRENTGIRYARTTVCTGNFGLEPDLYTYRPSAYHLMGWDALAEMGRKFLESESEERQVFYIWGHSYELDYYDTWSNFEEFCRLIANRDDIFYGTNREVLLGE
ncbi:MAG: polysaccharide deacetylase family protein [Clostridia bacterium]|nr:polysaccharide deacetylase family protein [Clostridia bacterium]